MNLLSKKLCAVLILLAISASFSTCLQAAYAGEEAEEPYVPDKVLVFLRDVVKLDLTEYLVTPSKPSFRYRDDLGGLPELAGIVDFQGHFQDGVNKLHVMYSFVNNTLNSLSLENVQGSPQFSQSISTDVKELAKDFLERYQAFTGNADLSAMRSMLDAVDLTKNSSIVSGNIRQEVTIRSDASRFNWKYTFNGAVYSGLGVGFKNGLLYSFGDDRSYFKVGGTDVNVTKEEAVSVALKQAETYAYTYAGEVIKNFTIVKDRIGAGLLTMGRDNPLLCYPYWTVSLPLDRVYPSFVYWIEVRMWADTGEIIDVKAMGYGGGLPPADTPNEPSEPSAPTGTATEDSPDMTLTFAAAGVILTVAAMTAATIIILKKRRSK